ncbi:MAG: GTP 3',8-cyclase MoaA [Candidatus Accumulibacter sp.]|uniref:GTP 3',8-cyclase n=1 Tax=Candidatus Accumulibacter affinis TaxID=2954384 RepID=A0A935W537_9PROT|nr:GTP 3',8-cyclase MoaA [Candidatus Accumulibacter affinis]
MRNESLTPAAVADSLIGFVPPTSPATSRHADGTLVDRYGRHLTYLRLSITDRCDFRCSYCMAEEMSFLPRAQVLTLEECLRVAGVFVGLGVNKVRVTGGEPLVRHNAIWLLEQLARLPGLNELVITTNGSQLDRYAPALRAAGVRRINISLDTLRADRFRAITRVGDLARVLRGLDAARAAGFDRLKLNTVMMCGCNDDELIDLLQFVVDRGIDIAFIEEMPLGEIGHARQGSYFSSEEALARLQTRFVLLPSTESSGGPARYWRIPGSATRVGFISPHSHNFCDSCNRVRVTARGDLYPCLGNNDASQLLPLLRANPTDDAPLRAAIVHSMGIKAKGHDFSTQMDAPQVVRFMSMTGG